MRNTKLRSIKPRRSGFTLVELLIVITIIAILAALAYPSLNGYLLKNKRSAAQQNLYALQLQQEAWRINHAQYTADINDLNPALASDPDYNFTISQASSSQYQLTATAKANSPQVQDRQGTQSCLTLTLNRSHEKTPKVCWE